MNQSIFIASLSLLSILSCKPKSESTTESNSQPAATDSLRYEQEKHLANVHQLTFGGDNAEAYWSFDGNHLTFQARRPSWNVPCDQIFIMDTHNQPDTSKIPPRISTGNGRTTCSYFLPG